MKLVKDQIQSVEEKLQDEFVDLKTKTYEQVDINKEGFTKIEKIVLEQIHILAVQLEKLKDKNDNESFFVAMKRNQDQIQSLEEMIVRLDKDNTVKKPKAILNVKRPIHDKDIIASVSSDLPFTVYGSLVLPNKQIIITDYENKKLKLTDKKQDKIISQVELSGDPYDITTVNENEVAVSVNGPPHTIQFFPIFKKSMYKVREFKCDGSCKGIDYNARDHTLVVTFILPPKVKIVDMKGNTIKCLEYDNMGNKLFNGPYYVALTPDMTSIYATDYSKRSVNLLSLNGNIKAVYKDKSEMLDGPEGVYVHTSGLVYVVGDRFGTVHELDPASGEFKVVLDEKDGLSEPRSISYCEIGDKMYIGMLKSSTLTVFQMKQEE